MNKNGSDKHYVSISKLITFLLTVVSGFIAFQIKNIGDAWIFVWAMSSGIGLVLILRWFWWRINAWSEITALVSSLLSILFIIIYTRYMGYELELKHQILVIPFSIMCWVIATFVTNPEPKKKLAEFYRKVRPWGFWAPISSLNPDITTTSFMQVIINWLLRSLSDNQRPYGYGENNFWEPRKGHIFADYFTGYGCNTLFSNEKRILGHRLVNFA